MIGELLAIGGAIAYSMQGVLMQIGYRRGTPHMSVLIGNITSIICFGLGLAWELYRGILPPLDLKAVLLFMAAGLMGSWVGRTTEARALERIGAVRISILRMLDPFWALILALILLREVASLREMAGIAVVIASVHLFVRDTARASVASAQGAVAGAGAGAEPATVGAAAGARRAVVAGATGGGQPRTGGLPGAHPMPEAPARAAWVGILFGVAASVGFASGTTLRKAALLILPTVLLGNLLISATGTVFVVLEMIALRRQRPVRLAGEPLLVFIAAGLSATLGQYLMLLSLQTTGVAVAVTLRNTAPFFTMLMGAVMLGSESQITLRVVLSTVLLMLGVVLVV